VNTQQTLAQLVDENYVYASVLYHFGIPFFERPARSLGEVCQEYGISEAGMIHCLEQAVAKRNSSNENSLPTFPVDLIIQYLQNAHQIFIKQRLPYLGKLIGHLTQQPSGASTALIHDLQFVYPLFAEDFIHHIYEEEDTLFGYIRLLQDFQKGKVNNAEMYYQMEQYSIQSFAIEHLVEDDEMLGLRRITQEYKLLPEHKPLLRVLYQELQAFEQELQTHARVENEILFPKALMLERQAREQWATVVSHN